MFGFSTQHQFYLHHGATDMRKGFDGLSGVIRDTLKSDPLDGSVYIFINRRRDRMKLLVWEHTGFMLYYKRLEKGTFEIPDSSPSCGKVRLRWETLMLLISGISLQNVRKRKRYLSA